MKKLFIVVSIGLFLASCSGANSNKEETSEEMKANTQAVEEAAEALESSAEELENKVKSTEQDVDSLLNDI